MNIVQEFISRNQIQIRTIGDILFLIYSSSLHIAVLYMWIIKVPPICGVENFLHFIAELIDHVRLEGVKSHQLLLFSVIPTMIISTIAIVGSLYLCCKRLIGKAAIWSGCLFVINIMTLMVCANTHLFVMIVVIGTSYQWIVKRYLILPMQRESR